MFLLALIYKDQNKCSLSKLFVHIVQQSPWIFLLTNLGKSCTGSTISPGSLYFIDWQSADKKRDNFLWQNWCSKNFSLGMYLSFWQGNLSLNHRWARFLLADGLFAHIFLLQFFDASRPVEFFFAIPPWIIFWQKQKC